MNGLAAGGTTTGPLKGISTALALAALWIVLGAAPARGAEPSEVLRYYGDASSATGAALGQGACDVNGDGYDDAIVGAWFWDKAPNTNVGAAYVLFGDPLVAGGDLNTPAATGAARIDGPATANAFVGFSVACLGDVSGDGIDDLGISYYVEEKAYVVLGAEDFGSIDLELPGDRAYEIRGSTDSAFDYNVGYSTAAAGDVNGDGLGDIAIGGVVADTQGRTNNGRVWVVAGQDGVTNVDLLDADPGQVLMTIDGRGSEDRLGAVAPAGDVNGDGTDDLVLGAYTATPWGSSIAAPGAAWVLWGGSTGEVDLAAIGDRGFAILGPQRQRDRLGVSVSAAGDVDGDGLDDVLVGGDGVYNAATGQRPGSAWLVHGSASTRTVFTDTAATPAVYECTADDGSGTCAGGEARARGYWIKGADSDSGTGSESTGYSLSGIGDVSGDGTPDFAIGAYGYDPVDPQSPPSTMAGAGAVWVVYGREGTATQDLAALTEGEGYRIDGLAAGDRFGRQVAALGDVDGNGFADFAGAGDFAERPLAAETPRSQAGEVAVALIGPLATETSLAAEPADGLEAGDAIRLDAGVEVVRQPDPVASEGTIEFRLDGDPIADCEAVAVVDGAAACETTLSSAGAHELVASYSGAGDLGASTSDPVELEVAAPPEPGPSEEPSRGGPGADALVGTDASDELRGRAGDDTLWGLLGDDLLFGGDGADTIWGGPGDDRLSGGRGTDQISGGGGDDRVDGGPDADVLRCGAGKDTAVATAGDEVGRSCERVV